MNGSTILAAFTALITLAVIAVIISQHAQTTAVISALGTATSGAINAAVSPVTSGSTTTS